MTDNNSQPTEKLKFTGERYTPEVQGNIFLEHMHRYLMVRDLIHNKTVLDIASGEGFGSDYLAQYASNVIGVDLSKDAIDHAKKKYQRDNLTFKVGSTSQIPLDDNSVDVVVSFETIEHHDEHEEMMAEIVRVLKPDGVLIISSPDKAEYSDVPQTNNPYHVRELYQHELEELLSKYFKYSEIYGQRVIFGSGIFSQGCAQRLVSIDSQTYEEVNGMLRTLYVIACASNEQLKDFPKNSFFEQNVLQSEVSKNSIIQLESQISQLQSSLVDYESQNAKLQSSNSQLESSLTNYKSTIARLMGSRSWRITAPLRALGRIFRRDAGVLRAIFRRLPSSFQNMLRRIYHLNRYHLRSNLDSETVSAAFNNLAKESQKTEYIASNSMIANLSDNELPPITISVVTHNSSKYVEQFSNTLSEIDYPFEKLRLVFVDNGSTDNTVRTVEEAVKELEGLGLCASLVQQGNVGYGGGHDSGIGQSDTEYVLVSNLDLTYDTSAIRRLVSHAMLDNENAAAWEMRQKPYEHPKVYDPISGTTNWNSHACVLLRKSAYKKVGGYSKDIFMYGEDVELSYRLRAAGFLLRYNPHAVVYHYTYDNPNEIKPLQYTGSKYANLYIRLSYGSFKNVAMVPIMVFWLIFAKQPFAGARLQNFKNVIKLLLKSPRLLKNNFTNKSKSIFPFQIWDYDITRDGAFCEGAPIANNPPKVSVITRTYKGREKILAQAIKSVANQTYPNIEHIISEDGDNTCADFVKNFPNNPLHSLIHIAAEGKGRSTAGNAALEKATGKWCIFLDDDDQFYCDHVETLVNGIAQNTTASFGYSMAFDVPTKNEQDWSNYSVKKPTANAFTNTHVSDEMLSHRNYFPIQTVLFDRSLFKERGGFDKDLDKLEDWLLWKKYHYKVETVFIPKTTSLYRTPYDAIQAADRMYDMNKFIDEVTDRAQVWKTDWDNKR